MSAKEETTTWNDKNNFSLLSPNSIYYCFELHVMHLLPMQKEGKYKCKTFLKNSHLSWDCWKYNNISCDSVEQWLSGLALNIKIVGSNLGFDLGIHFTPFSNLMFLNSINCILFALILVPDFLSSIVKTSNESHKTFL